MSSLKFLSKLNDSNKSLVFGYVRSIEKKSNMITIPMLIYYQILTYFYIHEYFTKCGDELEISEDKMTLKKIDIIHSRHTKEWMNNAYCNIWFASNGQEIATWKFKLNEIETPKEDVAWHEIYFVFVSKDERLNEDANSSEDAPNYGWSNNEETYHFGAGEDCVEFVAGCKAHENGDKVSITLNTKEGSIKWKRFATEEGDSYYVYKNIEQSDSIKYKLAVSLRSKNNSITLIDFKCCNA